MLSKISPIFLICIIAILTLISSLLIANLYRLYTNTLFNNSKWRVEKTLLSKGVYGAVSYLVTRQALSGDKLHLGAWHGYQEVTYDKKVIPSSISFRFYLQPNAYVSLIISSDSEIKQGIRFSNNILFPNAAFSFNEEGKFIAKQDLSGTPVNSNLWHTLRIKYAYDGYTVWLDDIIFYKYAGTTTKPQTFGFRGGYEDAIIDDIVIVSNNNIPEIYEYFDNRDNFFIALILSTGVLVAILCFIYVRSYKEEEPKKWLYIVTLANISIITIVTSLTFWNIFSATRYPRNPDAINWHGYTSRTDSEEDVIKILKMTYTLMPRQNEKRILFMGTSQTWGAGATNLHNTIAQQLEWLLNKDQHQRFFYQVINAGISGSTTSRLFELYSQGWIAFEPTVVVLNVSNNNTDQNTFIYDLEQFIHFNQARKIITVLIQEPNSVEYNNENLILNHKRMQEIAELYNIPIIPMHEIFKSYMDKGFIWWDQVHLTDYGQRIFSEELFLSLKKIL